MLKIVCIDSEDITHPENCLNIGLSSPVYCGDNFYDINVLEWTVKSWSFPPTHFLFSVTFLIMTAFLPSGGARSYGDKKVTLASILCFTTGCEEEPPLGFATQPYISFKHIESPAAPTANTCTNHLMLPCPKGVMLRNYDFENLYKLLDMGFSSEYFGLT